MTSAWKDLLQNPNETVTYPWVGGRSFQWSDGRTFTIEGSLPREFGWTVFTVKGRKVFLKGPSELRGTLSHKVCGYLVGDRMIPDGIRVDPDPSKILAYSERVHLVPDGLDRFVRVSAGRFTKGSPLIFDAEEFPLGPEDSVMIAFLDRR